MQSKGIYLFYINYEINIKFELVKNELPNYLQNDTPS